MEIKRISGGWGVDWFRVAVYSVAVIDEVLVEISLFEAGFIIGDCVVRLQWIWVEFKLGSSRVVLRGTVSIGMFYLVCNWNLNVD